MQLLLVDISRAYFKAKADPSRPTYVELPPGAEAPAGTCALLRRRMYGTQRAAEAWQDEYLSALVSMAFYKARHRLAFSCTRPRTSRSASTATTLRLPARIAVSIGSKVG